MRWPSNSRPVLAARRLLARVLSARNGSRRTGPRDYFRAVHYFGHAHPTNFWDAADLSEAPGHLARIKADGFDTVIFVVPWRGFQRTLTPPTFDELNLERLRKLMAIAEEARLKTILRVSYPWNADPDSEGTYDERILGLFTDERVRAAWLAYLARLRHVAERFDGFAFAFFSWEDLPSTRELMVHRGRDERRRLAQSMGYRAWLERRFPLSGLAELFGAPIGSFDEVYIPLADCEAYRTYVEFINAALDELLRAGRGAWPALAMQMRVDFDALVLDGKPAWVENDVRVDDPALRVTYWFLCMYTQSNRELLSAGEALANLGRMLDRVTGFGRNTNHFLDQFVFYDESPHFRHWPTIAPDEIATFLEKAAELLRRRSRGYALWNYFDYRVNHFYNPIFLRGLHGWIVDGDVRVEPGRESSFVWLAPGASVAQRIDPHFRGYAPSRYESVRFRALAKASEAGGLLAISADGAIEAQGAVAAGDGACIELTLPAAKHRDAEALVAIRNVGTVPIAVARVILWGAVYRSRIYDEDGRPDRFLEAVRRMNAVG